MSVEDETNDLHNNIREHQVKSALKNDKGNEAELLSWSIEDFTKKGDNFGSFVTSVKVCYVLEGKHDTTSYIVKIKVDLSTSTFKDVLSGIFIKEQEFYEHVAPRLNSVLVNVGLEVIHHPKCYYNSSEKGHELVFFEDLRTRGFKMADCRKGLDGPHMLLVLKELGRIHAASVVLKAKKPLSSLEKECDYLNFDWHRHPDPTDFTINKIFIQDMEVAADILHLVGGYEPAEKWLHEQKTGLMDMFNRNLAQEEPFNVICHGDCWTNNLLFRYDEEGGKPLEVMFVDFQLYRLASPTTDLSNLVFTTAIEDERNAREDQFMKIYYDSFTTVLSTAGKAVPFTFQQLMQDYRNKDEFGLIFAIMTVFLTLRPPEDAPSFAVDHNEIYENEKAYKMNMFKSNVIFKKKFLALFDEMVSHGLFESKR